MTYIQADFLNGPSRNIKVACIEDVMSTAFNFTGDSKTY
jgi:hypothetical protein